MGHPPLTRLHSALCAIALCASLSIAIAVSDARVPWEPASAEPRADASARPAPRPASPRDGAVVDALPAFSWRRARGATEYELQVAADGAFESIVDRGSVTTRNTYATLERTLADGTYHWRVRGLDSRGRATRWTRARRIVKRWDLRPELQSPAEGATVSYPSAPLVLRWSAVPHAYKYLVQVSTDPSLANGVLTGGREVETSATAFALPNTLAGGRYYWAVTPLNGRRHRGARSVVGSFTWSWPTATATRVEDLNPDARVYDPQLSWDPVPGAAQYEVEVNPSADFAPGSKVCCGGADTGTSVSPTKVLANNTYYWRVRAVDVDGNAGSWNSGPAFQKDFDAVTPTIPNLRMRDNQSDPAAPGTPVLQAPIADWDPVPGASSYEIQVVPYVGSACDWTSLQKIDVKTATTAWTPLGSPASSSPPGGVSFPRVSRDTRQLADGTTYCARVLARSDRDEANREVVSDWSQVNGLGNPAFTYDDPAPDPPPLPPGELVMPSGNYGIPQAGTVTTGMPLFTWTPVAGAASYYVVVAKDASFTNIVDVAFTRVAAYAPRNNTSPHTYSDETTTYYWAVMPAKQADGGQVTTQPTQDNPQPFQKRSTPPTLLAPSNGANVSGTPTFRWTSAEGARYYRLQIAQDPSFGDPIDDVTTASTAYTTRATYPADSVLYWRVRATDEQGVGLTWSETGTLRRRLPSPTPGADNPAGGETIPVLSWSPVQGAVSYDIHVDQADGTSRNFALRSTAFTPTAFYGTGVWHWQVRANFKSGGQTVSGGYFAPLPFARRVGTPAGARSRLANGGAVIQWEPSPMAKGYRVELSETNSFRSVIESATTDNTSYAPRMSRRGVRLSRLYWRVAVVDEGNNVGGWSSGRLVPAKAMRVTVRGRLARNRSRVVLVKVTSRGRPVRGAAVRVSGVTRAKARRTNRRGVARFVLRPRRSGRVVFRAVKRGYDPARRAVRVR